jgi:hypothetical protein
MEGTRTAGPQITHKRSKGTEEKKKKKKREK